MITKYKKKMVIYFEQKEIVVTLQNCIIVLGCDSFGRRTMGGENGKPSTDKK